MLTLRGIFAMVSGGFSMALALVTLARGRLNRLHIYFAAFNFLSALWLLGGWAMFIPNPTLATLVYRLIQATGPAGLIFTCMFIQEFSGAYDTTAARRLRMLLVGFMIAFAPFYPTSLMIKELIIIPTAEGIQFIRKAGPLYVPNLAIFFLFYVLVTIEGFRCLKISRGIKRNQVKFVTFAISIGATAMIFYVLSFTYKDWPAVYFSMSILMSFCFAYAIFKYQLLEFNLWMRRLAIMTGVYLTFMLVPFAFYLLKMGTLLPAWLTSPMGTIWLVIAYAVLFSFAPILNTFIRDRAEERRWNDIQKQMEVIKHASERLANEGQSLDEIGQKMTNVIRDFYWTRKAPSPSFVLVALMNELGNLSASIYPERQIDPAILSEFLSALKDRPSLLTKPFSPMDTSSATFSTSKNDPALQTIHNYLVKNDIEFCCPCLHNGEFNGVVLLGPKKIGVFWPEELTVLQSAAAHLAVAVTNAKLGKMNRQLKDLDDLKSELISNITHEFKSPLFVVEGAVDVLLSDLKNQNLNREKIGEYLLMIRNNTGQLGQFIQNLLNVAKIEQARVDLSFQKGDLIQAVRDTVSLFEPLAQKKGLSLLVTSGEKLKFSFDVEKIKQVISNIISNAIKFTKAGGVHIEVEEGPSSVHIRISDTGAGITVQDMPYIFDRFYSKEGGANTKRGTGLGLAIAKGWTEAHGGKIWAESKGNGHGTTFHIELPTVRLDANELEESA